MSLPGTPGWELLPTRARSSKSTTAPLPDSQSYLNCNVPRKPPTARCVPFEGCPGTAAGAGANIRVGANRLSPSYTLPGSSRSLALLPCPGVVESSTPSSSLLEFRTSATRRQPSIPNLQDHSILRRSAPALAVAAASKYLRQSECRRICMRASARLSKRPCRCRASAWTKAMLSSFAWPAVRWRLLVIGSVPASARVTID